MFSLCQVVGSILIFIILARNCYCCISNWRASRKLIEKHQFRVSWWCSVCAPHTSDKLLYIAVTHIKNTFGVKTHSGDFIIFPREITKKKNENSWGEVDDKRICICNQRCDQSNTSSLFNVKCYNRWNYLRYSGSDQRHFVNDTTTAQSTHWHFERCQNPMLIVHIVFFSFLLSCVTSCYHRMRMRYMDVYKLCTLVVSTKSVTTFTASLLW